MGLDHNPILYKGLDHHQTMLFFQSCKRASSMTLPTVNLLLKLVAMLLTAFHHNADKQHYRKEPWSG